MVELKIVVDDNGQVQISGPIQNKMLSYGMLELARDAIQTFAEKAAANNGIIPARTLPFVKS